MMGAVEHSEETPYSGHSRGNDAARSPDLADSLRGPRPGRSESGSAGLVRWPDGVFVWGPHVRGENLAIRDRLEHELGLPILGGQ